MKLLIFMFLDTLTHQCHSVVAVVGLPTCVSGPFVTIAIVRPKIAYRRILNTASCCSGWAVGY